jgi:uncharacterized repeat protein (TIGR01451 family)
VPLPEDELLSSFGDRIAGCGRSCSTPRSPIRTLISIVVSADGTQILYDHHEDRYERDPSNPAGLKPGGSTEIWGDGDLSNGVAPGYPNDLLDAGDVISLDNDVSVPSGAIFFDGADKVVASFPVVMTRAAIPTGPGALQAGAMEASPIERWGRSYVAPVGVDTRNSSSMFQYNALYVMARTDNTVCDIDPDPDRSGERGEGTQTINEGKTLVVENVHDGGTVDCDKNVHVDQITGDIGVNYETRWFSLTPTSRLTNDYYGPVGNPRDRGETFVYVHNPTGSSMTVQCQTDAGSCGTEPLGPGETRRTSRIPDGSGVRVFSSNAGDRFAALSVIDYGGQIYDWGYNLEPRKELSTQALVGLGLGCTNSNSCDRSRSVVWVTPSTDTTIYVNRDGGQANCPGGAGADESHFVRALEAVLLTDPSDNDMTGARIYTCDENAPFVAAWGQDPQRSRSGDNEGLDMGTLVPPLPRVSATKFAALYIDLDGDGDFSPGDTIRYSIRVSNNSPFDLPVDAINVQDSLPTAASYVPGSTTYQADDSTATIPVADDTSGTAFPLDGAGKNNLAVIPGNQAATFAFDVLIDVTRGECSNDFVNTGEVRFPVDSDDPIPLEDRRRLTCSPAIDLEKSTNGQDADPGPGPSIEVGDPVTWTYLVTNTGSVDLTDVTVTDDQGVSVTCPQTTLAAGAPAMTCTASGTAVAGQYANLGTVAALTPNGSRVTDTDPSHYFGGRPSIHVLKTTNGVHATSGTGPVIPVDDPVTWKYIVTNNGNEVLDPILVEDDQLGGDITADCDKAALAVGEFAICTVSDTATAGQYANEATVTGTPPSGPDVIDRDPSHYFGAHPGLSLEKRVNDLDADVAPGPEVLVGDTVTFTFRVENTGNEALTDVTVLDDQLGTIACPQDTLAVGERMVCTVEAVATLGQHENTATVTGTPPVGGPLTPVPDKGHYFGARPGITLEKRVNGDDADTPPGVRIPAGGIVTWDFVITNTGNDELTDIVLTDDQLGDIACPRTTLDASGGANDSMTCTASGTATAGQ